MSLIVPLALAVTVARAPFATATEAKALLDEGAAVLDTRGGGEFRDGHLPGAARIDWKDFRDGWGRTGRLDDDDAALGKKLGAFGIETSRPVIVCGGTAAGWGEEGRIAWMLAYLGHPRAYILDGGMAAWREAGLPVETGGGRAPPARTFMVHRNNAIRAELSDAVAASQQGSGILLDARTPEEWNGARPYWEPRGGHIPGARLLPWKDLLDGRGRLRPAGELKQMLAARGVRGDRPVIAYCTGGVRSAFVWAALRSLGFPTVANFDGSFWAWSMKGELPVVVGDEQPAR